MACASVLPPSLAGLRVLVVGLARSGRAAARLALREGAQVTCADARTDLPDEPGCRMALGPHRRADFLDTDIIVVSPGVPGSQPDLVAAQENGIPVVGELALAASRVRVPILAISGTNGKSTVTHFTGQLLQAAGRHPFVGGNLGLPFTEALLGEGFPYDCAVVEVSSYQMEFPGSFAPAAAVILNLTPDHLARHKTMEIYGAHKCRMFDRMAPSAPAILPAGDGLLARLAEDRGGRRLFLDGVPGVRTVEDAVLLEDGDRMDQVLLDRFTVPGRHNRSNAAAAMLLCWSWGVPAKDLHPEVLTALAHRMEPVATVNGVLWINDSKATNVAASVVGLSGLDRDLVVLLGGEGKEGDDYRELVPALGRARHVICFGFDGSRIADALEGAGLTLHWTRGMKDAVALARTLARPGQAVVLSPACASFDEFQNFEHRGAVFADLARSAS